jgi:calcineurin-like phosphoesterase family protein
MYFFTADEHYFHYNIIKYCHRPFNSIDEMHKTLISNHNKVVDKNDTTVHAGDFSFGNKEDTSTIIKQLNGNHIFLMGCHDYWLRESTPHIKQFKINKTKIIVCHYPMSSWLASFHGSISLHGHSHGKMPPIQNRLEIGVDTNNYTPVSFTEVLEKIKIQNNLLYK